MSEVLTSGATFAGRYRVERFLARGGMGAVYVAEQIATERKVALKVIFRHVLSTSNARERFELEARVAARVKSEHIVDVIDAGIDPETELAFIVMELLEGESLDEMVEKRGPQPTQQVARFIEQLGSALSRAHSYIHRDGRARPIVHRDLKPDNLFVTRRESGEAIIKVLDFGIAKLVSTTTDVSQEVKGTPQYMASEQMRNGRITPQTDIWAMGLIAFFTVTGVSYWKVSSSDEATLFGLITEVLSEPMDPASRRATELGAVGLWPTELDAWFATCVHRDPLQRFGSAHEASTAFLSALGIEPRVNLSPLDAAVAGVGEPLAPSATNARPGAQPETSDWTPPARANDTYTGKLPLKSRKPLWIAATLVVAVGAGAIFSFGSGEPPEVANAARAPNTEPVSSGEGENARIAAGDVDAAATQQPEPPRPQPQVPMAASTPRKSDERKATEAPAPTPAPERRGTTTPTQPKKHDPASLYRTRGQRLP